MNDTPNKEQIVDPQIKKIRNHSNGQNNHLKKVSPSFKEDLKISWKIFGQNWRTYVSFSLFAFLGAIILLVILSLLLGFLLVRIMVILNQWDFLESGAFLILVVIFINIPSSFIILGLFGCVWGLSNDIIASGDEFSEFKSAFIYFRRYWWQYICFNLIAGFLNLAQAIIFSPQLHILSISSSNRVFYLILAITTSIIGVFLFCAFIMTFPSITAQGNFRRAVYENFVILRQSPLRIFKVILFYFIACSLPIIIMNYVFYFYLDALFLQMRLFFIIFFLIYSTISISIMYPLLSLMLTRIYHTSSSQESWKLDRDQQNIVKIEPKFSK